MINFTRVRYYLLDKKKLIYRWNKCNHYSGGKICADLRWFYLWHMKVKQRDLVRARHSSYHTYNNKINFSPRTRYDEKLFNFIIVYLRKNIQKWYTETWVLLLFSPCFSLPAFLWNCNESNLFAETYCRTEHGTLGQTVYDEVLKEQVSQYFSPTNHVTFNISLHNSQNKMIFQHVNWIYVSNQVTPRYYSAKSMRYLGNFSLLIRLTIGIGRQVIVSFN